MATFCTACGGALTRIEAVEQDIASSLSVAQFAALYIEHRAKTSSRCLFSRTHTVKIRSNQNCRQLWPGRNS